MGGNNNKLMTISTYFCPSYNFNALYANSGNSIQKDKYAVIEIGGVQKIVEEGRHYTCNRLKVTPGTKVLFGRVLAAKNDGKLHVGAPWIDNASVEAHILDEFKGDKIIVYKMKPKKHFRSKDGHRQLMTRFLVTQINLN